MAPPVSKDGFFHSGTSFYVESNGHHHPRESSAKLHSLLSKQSHSGGDSSLPRKDPPGHFYTAQLVHYGLKALRTKDAAKKLLLKQFDDGNSLVVPARILKIEAELSAEYAQQAALEHAETSQAADKSGPGASSSNVGSCPFFGRLRFLLHSLGSAIGQT